MTLGRPLVAAFVLLAVTLAGCSGSEDGGVHGFVVDTTPADPITEPYVFRATVSGDGYEWDMGDGRAKQTGKTVEYVYGFTDGTVKPKLTVLKGDERTTYTARTITLGNGANGVPSFQLGIEWDWVTVGEAVTFTGAASTDPDGDPLLFSWFCQRLSDIGPAGAGHAHGGGGVVYGAAGADPIPSVLLNGTNVPAADRDLGQDVCGSMAGNGAFTEEATLRGSFAERGIYKITMLAKDPKTPSIPGSHTIFVTDASEPRIVGPVTIPFSGSFDYGVPAQLDAAMTEAGQRDTYVADTPFTIKYPLVGFALDFNYGAGPSGQNLVTYHLVKPNGGFRETQESSADLQKDAGYLDPSASVYNLRVYGRAGNSLTYDGTITLEYVTNPVLLFDDPAGH